MATDSQEVLEKEVLLRINQAELVLESIAGINVDGVGKLRNKLKQEIQFLSKIHKAQSYKKDHLTCSNLKHLQAVAGELIRNAAVCVGVMVTKTLTEEDGSVRKLCVDLVLHDGRVWIKVVARNPKALALVSAGDGYYGQKSITEQAAEFADCADEHPQYYEPPTVIFRFVHGINWELAKELEEEGVKVEDASVEGPQEISSLSSVIPKQVQDNPRLNLCLSTMLAYVSGLTNGGANYFFENPLLLMHAEFERKRPIKPLLDQLFKDKDLYCCQTALEIFQNILDTLGGPGECQRAENLLKRVTVVDDQVSTSLSTGGRVKYRSLAIFGTGEALKAVTATANNGFIRSAKSQGVNFVVFVHESRYLSEGKQIPIS